MGLLALLVLAVGLSMDAFAAAICAGLTMPAVTVRKAAVVGLYFGVFQAVMPLIGYFAATWFTDKIVAYDHWIAFALLCFLGGKMILVSFKKQSCPCGRACLEETRADKTRSGCQNPDRREISLTPAQMLPLALATSVDALAVGVSFAFLRINILAAVACIGATTFALSMLGVKIGHVFGARFKAKAERAGGVILIAIGLKILLDHL